MKQLSVGSESTISCGGGKKMPNRFMAGFLAVFMATASQILPSWVFLPPAVSVEAPKKFKSCDEMRKSYKYGVALNQTTITKSKTSVYPPALRPSIYKVNKTLDRDKDGIACEVTKKPSVAPKVTAPAPDTLPNSVSWGSLHPVATHKIAVETINELISQATPLAADIREIVGPGVSPESLSVERRLQAKSMRLWANVFIPPKDKVRLIYVSPTDGEWMDAVEIREGLGAMSPVGNTLRNRVETNDCRFASAGIVGGTYTMIQCLNPRVMGTIERQTGPHEYTHFVQFSSAMLPDYAPCWITEGMASFYGIAIGWEGSDKEGKTRTLMLKQHASSFGAKSGQPGNYAALASILRSSNEASAISILRALENPNCGLDSHANLQTAYVVGHLAFEALVAVKGHASVEVFLSEFSRTRDWRASFETSFGLKVESFYSHLTPYFASTIDW